MRDQLKKALRSNIIAGVEFVFLKSKDFYNLVVLEQTKEEVRVIKKFLLLDTLEELKAALAPIDTIYLVVNTKFVLHKTLAQDHEDDQQLLQQFFPNAKLKDFYVQREKTADGIVVSVVRKLSIDQTVNRFSQQGLSVLGIRLGAFDLKYLLDFLADSNSLETETQSFQFNDRRELLSFSKIEEPSKREITIGNEKIDTHLIVAFAIAFKMLIARKEDGLVIPSLQENQKEFFHRRLFQKAGWAFLGGTFLIVLLNLFFYYHYKEKNAQLNTQTLYSDAQIARLDTLKKQVEAQQQFLQKTQLNQNSKSSFLADRIAASLPAGLQLSTLDIFPMQGKPEDYREGELQGYRQNEIIVKGYCKESKTYNAWIKALEQEEWVQSIQHLDYKDLNRDLAAFEMKMLLNF